MTTPAYPADVLARAAKIRLIGFDVDGTLTDGSLHYGTGEQDGKTFHVQDGMGLTLLRHAGIQTALVTARHSPVVAARGTELKIAHLHIGERSKLTCMQRIADGMGIGMEQVAFMGDDLPDLAALRGVGLAIAPANAHHWVSASVHWQTQARGGEGAARELCDLLLDTQGHTERLLSGTHP